MLRRSLFSARFFHSTLTAKMSKDLSDETVYEKAKEYWADTASNVDGMLGGFKRLHAPDVNDSKAFLMDLKKKNYLTNFGRALDCGAGIGRVSKHLLLPLFTTVDMVDVTDKFIEKSNDYIGDCSKIGNRFVEGLQTFEPQENFYDVIWIQWVISHLTDEDCVKFLERCKAGLTENGCIVVKENHASGDERDFDSTDYSWTRTKPEFLSIFEQANLNVVYEKKQKHFPKGMYPVFIIALKPTPTSNEE